MSAARRAELLPVWWTRCLARGGDPLDPHRTDVADANVAPLRIVEGLDVVKHVHAGLIARAVDFRTVRSAFNEEKKLSMAALSQTLLARLMLQGIPLSTTSL